MDRYTKLILAIIAGCLIWICIRDIAFVSDALAASGVVKVEVVEIDFNRYRPVPVEVKGVIECRD